MDMTKFLRRALTNEALKAFHGRYEGRIAAVTAGTVFNKWSLRSETVPTIEFEDGWQWIPNIGARRVLTAAWGAETDGWIGRRMAVTLNVVTRTERASGRLIEMLEKRAEPLAAEVHRLKSVLGGNE